MLGKTGQEEKRVIENEMVGLHHQLNGHESEQTLGDGEGQRSLVCCSPWGCRVGQDRAAEQQQRQQQNQKKELEKLKVVASMEV